MNRKPINVRKVKIAALVDDHRLRNKRTPQYRKLVDTLTEEIARGKHPIGRMLPTENDLSERFQVSRFTVREALRDLVTQGLIVRRQGSGSVVVATEPARSLAQELWSLEKILQYASDSYLRIMAKKMVVADAELAVLLQCQIGETWYLIETIRMRKYNPTPLGWSDVYLRPEYSSIANVIGTSDKLVYGLLQDQFGLTVTNVQVEIRSGTLSKRKAKTLSLKGGSPSLVIVRRYKAVGGKVAQISVSEHPAGRFSFSINLRHNRARRRQT